MIQWTFVVQAKTSKDGKKKTYKLLTAQKEKKFIKADKNLKKIASNLGRTDTTPEMIAN